MSPLPPRVLPLTKERAGSAVRHALRTLYRQLADAAEIGARRRYDAPWKDDAG